MRLSALVTPVCIGEHRFVDVESVRVDIARPIGVRVRPIFDTPNGVRVGSFAFGGRRIILLAAMSSALCWVFVLGGFHI